MELARGRRAPFTQVGDWVALSKVSRTAKLLYQILSMHVSQLRSDGAVWPSRSALAALLGYAKPDSVDPFLKELAKLDAIEVRQRRKSNGSLDTNVYVIHETPPPDYQGLKTLSEFYADRTPSRGVPPNSGVGVAPISGVGVAPSSGYELEEVELEEVELDEKKNSRATSALPPSFEAWYAAYPIKKARGAAEKAYPKALAAAAADKRVKAGEITAAGLLLAAARSYAEDPNRSPQFTKHPATWLNQQCWLDERLPVAPVPQQRVNLNELIEVDGMQVTRRNAAALERMKNLASARQIDAKPLTALVASAGTNELEGAPW